mgnify:CR=1 FL=1
MNTRLLLILGLTVPLGACRPDIGAPLYGDFVGDDDDSAGGVDPNNFPGPDPYEDGEERLSVGIFYEGGFSSQITLEAGVADYFIYEGTYESFPDFENREEGYQSDIISPTGVGWWGGGVTWAQPLDLSAWTQLHISFASADPGFASFDVGFGGGGAAEVRATVTDYGFVNDGAWHQVVIPLSVFEAGGADLSSVGLPIQLIADGLVNGEELRVDNLYFTKETPE